MDYLDSIDCSLEDFQAMLYGKQCGIDFDTQEVRWHYTHTHIINTHLGHWWFLALVKLIRCVIQNWIS